MEEQPSVKLSDHVDVDALGGQEEQKQLLASSSSSVTPSSIAEGRPSSFYDLRIAVVGNVDSGQCYRQTSAIHTNSRLSRRAFSQALLLLTVRVLLCCRCCQASRPS